MVALAAAFHKRLVYILTEQGIETDQKAAADIILKHAPDWRRVLNECQRLSIGGSDISNSSTDIGNNNTSALVKCLKDKDFKKMRHWVANNMDIDASTIFRSLYDGMTDTVANRSMPQLVLILADYQYKHAFVADHELNVVACMTEIMANVEFK